MTGIALILTAAALCAAPSTTDYAEAAHREDWLRHPVLGDPSFDAFTRLPGNPVLRGTPPFEWPVNGFLLEDPVSGDWFLYVGRYLKGYALSAEQPTHCLVMRSPDRGKSWETVGPAFSDAPHVFAGETHPMTHAPDVSVVFADGKYHMVYDWVTGNSDWSNIFTPTADTNSGVGYAWADSPAGPFHPTPVPVATTRAQTPLLGKYRRMYASTLLRRAQDWLVLTLTDSGPHFGWALTAFTAKAPEGPWSAATLVLHPERPAWHPPLLEFFPAFAHDGWAYAPATSVARSRNYQALFRAPLEKAHDPAAWELFQAGSVWHAEPVESEAKGIWGQTFSGFVGKDGVFTVMFPSQDAAGNGTIHLAARPWDTPFRERGFVLSGHEGPSLTLLKYGVSADAVEMEMTLRGTAVLVWNHTGVLDPNKPSSDATPHAHTLAGFSGFEAGPGGWRLVEVAPDGAETVAAAGNTSMQGAHALSLTWTAGKCAILLDGQPLWEGAFPAPDGNLGLLVRENTHLAVDRFGVRGEDKPGCVFWGWREGLLGAAEKSEDWTEVADATSRSGSHVVSTRAGLQAKWNIEGDGFALWAPAGPGFGEAAVLVDGKPAGTFNAHAEAYAPSAPRFALQGLVPGRHTVILKTGEAAVPLDVLEVRAG